ncbi:MAG: hypothetical protein E6G56_09760 [Actinobacteria bacterium]|nr:MAG: hypothetical protein E6G56_09760 [Actinomycetota bacterium]
MTEVPLPSGERSPPLGGGSARSTRPHASPADYAEERARLRGLRTLASDVVFAGPLGWLLRRRAVRWLLTSGYRSGLIAFGERNDYRIPPRWVTVDLFGADFNLDVRTGQGLPFADGSQRVVYTSHTIEHLDDQALAALLAEFARVLGASGHVRIETPDAERITQAYLGDDERFFAYFERENRASLVQGLGLSPAYAERHNALIGLFSCYLERGHHVGVLAPREEVERRLRDGDLESFGAWCVSLQTAEQRASGGHVNVLYFDKLRRMLIEAGFRDVRRMENGVTQIPRLSLRWIERPGPRAGYSLYLEATAQGLASRA